MKMPYRLWALLFLLLCAATAQAAGFAFIEVPADRDGPALRGAVWTPCALPAQQISLDTLRIAGVQGCPIAGKDLPLVVVSHGSGGSFLGHHDTAEALADGGFVVAAISHPGDNFRDLSRQGHLSAFATRPVDMRRLVDYMLGRWPGHAQIDAGRVGFFGFSRGGYTALVAAGAVPDFTSRPELCPAGSPVPLCAEIRRHELPPPPAADARIKAAVVVDPLNLFGRHGLERVAVPIQLWASERGGDGVTPASVEELRRDLPVAPEWHPTQNTAHFAFLAPCTPEMSRALPELCVDAPGFDRAAFHQAFDAEVLAFFRRHLARPADRPGS